MKTFEMINKTKHNRDFFFIKILFNDNMCRIELSPKLAHGFQAKIARYIEITCYPSESHLNIYIFMNNFIHTASHIHYNNDVCIRKTSRYM